VSHRDYTDLIDQHTDEFDAADEAMTSLAIAALEGKVSMAEAEDQMTAVVLELQARSTQWVLSVLPAVALDAVSTATRRLGTAGITSLDDTTEQRAALELSQLELMEALHNAAEQMARDARRQIRDGLRVRMEEEMVGVAP